MKKVVFYIDDFEYFRRKFNMSEEQIKDFFGDKESFRVIYTLIGLTNSGIADRYELTDYNGKSININSLNGYERGVILADCARYYEGRECEDGSSEPCGVVKIEESKETV